MAKKMEHYNRKTGKGHEQGSCRNRHLRNIQKMLGLTNQTDVGHPLHDRQIGRVLAPARVAREQEDRRHWQVWKWFSV